MRPSTIPILAIILFIPVYLWARTPGTTWVRATNEPFLDIGDPVSIAPFTFHPLSGSFVVGSAIQDNAVSFNTVTTVPAMTTKPIEGDALTLAIDAIEVEYIKYRCVDLYEYDYRQDVIDEKISKLASREELNTREKNLIVGIALGAMMGTLVALGIGGLVKKYRVRRWEKKQFSDSQGPYRSGR